MIYESAKLIHEYSYPSYQRGLIIFRSVSLFVSWFTRKLWYKLSYLKGDLLILGNEVIKTVIKPSHRQWSVAIKCIQTKYSAILITVSNTQTSYLTEFAKHT